MTTPVLCGCGHAHFSGDQCWCGCAHFAPPSVLDDDDEWPVGRMTLTIGSLFSGAGGLDLAVEQVFGGETVWHCEVDPAASKVLAYRWPDVPNHGDITAAAPSEPGKNGPRLAAVFSEWLMGWPAGWVTDMPGISRNDALRLTGNGVVPQQATAALRHLLDVACEVA